MRPCVWVIIPSGLIRIPRHCRQHIAQLGVRLVLALGVHVKEHRCVGIIDRLDANALVVVLRVVFVFVFSAQTERTKATANRLFKGVVISFVGAAVLLICTEQHIAGVRQLIV